MAKNTSNTRSIQCHVCKVETEHKLLCHQKKSGQEEIGDTNYGTETASWSVTSEVYQCGGCKELAIRRLGEHDLADYPSEDYFPPRPEDRKEKARARPIWISLLPDGMESLCEEIYTALQSKSFRLVAMGLRALMDELLNHTIGDIGGFEKKVDKMVADGFLSKLQKEVLDPTLELGHAAIHRGHTPSSSQVDAALSIVESLLELFYVQKLAIDRLKAGVKPRQMKKPDSMLDAGKGRRAIPTAVKKAEEKPGRGPRSLTGRPSISRTRSDSNLQAE